MVTWNVPTLLLLPPHIHISSLNLLPVHPSSARTGTFSCASFNCVLRRFIMKIFYSTLQGPHIQQRPDGSTISIKSTPKATFDKTEVLFWGILYCLFETFHLLWFCIWKMQQVCFSVIFFFVTGMVNDTAFSILMRIYYLFCKHQAVKDIVLLTK